jgi:DNA-binding MarR family transcriptional regulator
VTETDYSLPTKFDPLIHQSSRLSILAVLAGAESADFTYLLQATGLTKGTLSKHLTKLREVGYIEIEKSFKDNFPNTTAKLTARGRKAFDDYRSQYIAFSKTMGSG